MFMTIHVFALVNLYKSEQTELRKSSMTYVTITFK